MIHDLKPAVWFGMSTYGLHLASNAEVLGIDLAASSVTKLVCAAEPLSAAKREKLERSWGAEVFDSFGMTECGLMGVESPAHDGLVFWSDLFHVEVVDPDTMMPVPEGEVGLMINTPMWTNNATPFLRWNSADLVSVHYPEVTDDPYSVFPRLVHVRRTAGFFKVRGVNINHSEFEDMMFANVTVNDFKCEIVTDKDLDILRVSIEVKRGADTGEVASSVGTEIKRVFEVTPDVVVLETGSLAREFEAAVKAPRFADKRA